MLWAGAGVPHSLPTDARDETGSGKICGVKDTSPSVGVVIVGMFGFSTVLYQRGIHNCSFP